MQQFVNMQSQQMSNLGFALKKQTFHHSISNLFLDFIKKKIQNRKIKHFRIYWTASLQKCKFKILTKIYQKYAGISEYLYIYLYEIEGYLPANTRGQHFPHPVLP